MKTAAYLPKGSRQNGKTGRAGGQNNDNMLVALEL